MFIGLLGHTLSSCDYGPAQAGPVDACLDTCTINNRSPSTQTHRGPAGKERGRKFGLGYFRSLSASRVPSREVRGL